MTKTRFATALTGVAVALVATFASTASSTASANPAATARTTVTVQAAAATDLHADDSPWA